jgi:hypothetical protein
MEPATQVTNPWRTVTRTVFQIITALAAAAPLIFVAITQSSPEAATGAGAIVLGVAGAITRVMAIPAVDQFIRKFLPFLAPDVPPAPLG